VTRRSLQHGVRSDHGFTLIEVVLTTTITAVVLALVVPVLQAVFGAISTSNAVLSAEAQGRLALDNLSLQVSSAVEICLPTQFSSAGFTVRVLDVVSTTGTGGTLAHTYQWDQWTVSTSDHTLKEEQAAPQSSTSGSGVAWPDGGGSPAWVTVAHGVVNTTAAPFVGAPATPGSGSPLGLEVDLQLAATSGSMSTTEALSSDFAALDTPYYAALNTGYPPGSTSCMTGVTPAQ
jgi:prepilin-type N-terminal cleavage/methylation domain-containing protein